jgi:hypothetical protein
MKDMQAHFAQPFHEALPDDHDSSGPGPAMRDGMDARVVTVHLPLLNSLEKRTS